MLHTVVCNLSVSLRAADRRRRLNSLQNTSHDTLLSHLGVLEWLGRTITLQDSGRSYSLMWNKICSSQVSFADCNVVSMGQDRSLCQWGSRPPWWGCRKAETLTVSWGFYPDGPQLPAGGSVSKSLWAGNFWPQGPGGEQVMGDDRLQPISFSAEPMILCSLPVCFAAAHQMMMMMELTMTTAG